MHVVNLVGLDQVFEEHEDVVAKQTGLAAEICILELAENLRDQRIEVRVVRQNLLRL